MASALKFPVAWAFTRPAVSCNWWWSVWCSRVRGPCLSSFYASKPSSKPRACLTPPASAPFLPMCVASAWSLLWVRQLCMTWSAPWRGACRIFPWSWHLLQFRAQEPLANCAKPSHSSTNWRKPRTAPTKTPTRLPSMSSCWCAVAVRWKTFGHLTMSNWRARYWPARCP